MKKIYRFLKNCNLKKFYTCQLFVVDTTPNKGSKAQIRTLYVKTTNALFIYINGKKVNLHSTYQVAPLKNKNFITIKIKGLFNSKTRIIKCSNIKIKTIEHPFAKGEKLKLNLTLNKKILLDNNRIMNTLKSDIIKNQHYKNLSFNKLFKLKPNNQSLKTINKN